MDTATLENEIAALRDSLREAEDICRAIRHGEVDAVLVGRSDEEKQVLVMSGAYTRYRQIVEDIAQGAVTLSSSGEILFSNHSFAAMLGLQPKEIFRTPIDGWVADRDRAQLALLKQGRLGPHGIAIALRRPDGTEVPVTLSQVVAGDDFVTALFTDLSASKATLFEAEAILEAIRTGGVDAFVVDGKQVRLLESANTLYRTMVERMRQGAVTISAAGEIVYANERFVALAGVPQGRIVGARLADYIAEEHQAAFHALVKKGSGDAELKLVSAYGQRAATLASMTTMDGHKLFIFTDISERKRHQAFDELTRRFLSMMAHEFRNILAPISASAHFLKMQGGLDAEGSKAVEAIERNVGRLSALVEDLRRINPKE